MMKVFLVLFLILFMIPAVSGAFFARNRKTCEGLIFSWVSGQIVLWAGFQILSIPLILLQKSFSLTVILYSVLMGVVSITALYAAVKRVFQSDKRTVRLLKRAEKTEGFRPGVIFLWIIVGLLLLLQLILTIRLSYEEGDDAFYVAISTITEASDTMYRVLPYTGMTTGLDARHGLAPFPVWIAFLARVSGIPAVVVAQVILPVILILMAYGIYYLIAHRLFAEKPKNIPFFLILTELMVLFGGYSVFSAENFLLVRASQGKAVIANIIIPFLVYLLLLFLEKIQQNEKIKRAEWALLAMTMTAGCLCSTLGTLLTCMLVGVAGLCTAFSYRRWKLLFPMALCCTMPVVMALLYFVLE